MKRLLIATLALGLAACAKKAEEVAPGESTPNAAASVAAAVPSPPPAAPEATDDVPTEEDFEAEAERQITSQNLEAELDKLEKEIAER